MKRLSKAALQAELTQSQEQVADLTETDDLLLVKNAALKACPTEYEHRLNKMSHNRSKPPSSDGLRKRKVLAKPSTSPRQSGCRPGHNGATSNRSDHVDHIEDHYPTVCEGRGGSLTPDPNATVTTVRQVQDGPNRHPIEVTDHIFWKCHCETCGVNITREFPTEVTASVPYGSRLNELMVYLEVSQLTSLRRMSHVISA